jgi:hypothetical protein
MLWDYKLTTNTIWTSFDFGQVEANTHEEAEKKALKKLKYDLSKANDALAHCDITDGFTIDMDFSQLEVTEANVNNKTLKVKEYTFGELNPEAQKIVIEGHMEFMNLLFDRNHTYLEVTDDLTKHDYKYGEGGSILHDN